MRSSESSKSSKSASSGAILCGGQFYKRSSFTNKLLWKQRYFELVSSGHLRYTNRAGFSDDRNVHGSKLIFHKVPVLNSQEKEVEAIALEIRSQKYTLTLIFDIDSDDVNLTRLVQLKDILVERLSCVQMNSSEEENFGEPLERPKLPKHSTTATASSSSPSLPSPTSPFFSEDGDSPRNSATDTVVLGGDFIKQSSFSNKAKWLPREYEIWSDGTLMYSNRVGMKDTRSIMNAELCRRQIPVFDDHKIKRSVEAVEIRADKQSLIIAFDANSVDHNRTLLTQFTGKLIDNFSAYEAQPEEGADDSYLYGDHDLSDSSDEEEDGGEDEGSTVEMDDSNSSGNEMASLKSMGVDDVLVPPTKEKKAAYMVLVVVTVIAIVVGMLMTH